MKLIDLLVQELPKRGGWNDGTACVQDDTRQLWFFRNGLPVYEDGIWCPDSSVNSFDWTRWGIFLGKKASDNHTTFVCKEEYEAALAASKQAEWDGEGFPPVGCECEWQDKNTKHWMKVFIVYASEWVTVIREDKIADAVEIAIENYGDEERRQFRPIRTEAEHKREEVINRLSDEAAIGVYITKGEAECIYDAIAAGKIPGVKLTD